jgi:phosphatidylethanolamine-binding protein (PEBP) family uncharacterized protein
VRSHSVTSLLLLAAVLAAAGCGDSNETGSGESVAGGKAGEAGSDGAAATSDGSGPTEAGAPEAGMIGSDAATAVDAGRGADDAGPGGDAGRADAGQGSAGAFTLTSTMFTNGAMIPVDATCETTKATSQMPALMWMNPPAGTMSFAIVFVDTTLVGMMPPNTNGFHSALWDVPANVAMLPQGLPAGSPPAGIAGLESVKQKKAPSGMAYLGPCPNFPSMTRTKTDEYAFQLYALPVATLPANTSSMTIQQIQSAIMAVPPLGMAVLSGKSNAAGSMLK